MDPDIAAAGEATPSTTTDPQTTDPSAKGGPTSDPDEFPTFEGPAFGSACGFFRSLTEAEARDVLEALRVQVAAQDPECALHIRYTVEALSDELIAVEHEVVAPLESAQVSATKTLFPSAEAWGVWKSPWFCLGYLAVMSALLLLLVTALFQSPNGRRITAHAIPALSLVLSTPWIFSMSRSRLVQVFKNPEFIATCVGFLLSQTGYWYMYIVLGVGPGAVVLGILYCLAACVAIIGVDAAPINGTRKTFFVTFAVLVLAGCFIVARFAGHWYPAEVRSVYNETINFGVLRATPQMMSTSGFLTTFLFFGKFLIVRLANGREFSLLTFRTRGHLLGRYGAPTPSPATAPVVETPLQPLLGSAPSSPGGTLESPVAASTEESPTILATDADTPAEPARWFSAFSLHYRAHSANVQPRR